MILKTKQKILIASILSRLVLTVRRLMGAGPVIDCKRGGINWRLDLQEGIDLSIYLLGAFEPRCIRAYRELIQSGSMVLDIGANIGAHTLPLAQAVGVTGRVVAFEPTAFAFAKLSTNLELNPGLSKRITALQVALGASMGDEVPDNLYSSWPLNMNSNLHAKHRGRAMATGGAFLRTVDQVIGELGVEAISFIKIDVDGHELPILRGARKTIERFAPTIMIELSPYVHEEEGYSFEELVTLLVDSGYRFKDANNGRELPSDPQGLRSIIPDGGCINAIAYMTSQ